MKILTKDEQRNTLLHIRRTDGGIAIEGKDFVKLQGEYHESGKWYYSDGGIETKNIAYSIISLSSRSVSSHQFIINIVENNELIMSCNFGKVYELPAKPNVENLASPLPLNHKDYEKAIDYLLQSYIASSRNCDGILEKWELANDFF